MTLSEFNALTNDEKAAVVLTTDVIAVREAGELSIFLHQTHSFYIEAFFDKQQWGVVRFRAFTDTNLLEPYLTSIDISNLVY